MCWHHSDQRPRWVATALLKIEPGIAYGERLSFPAGAPANHAVGKTKTNIGT